MLDEEVGKAFVSLLDEALLSNYEEGVAAGRSGSTEAAPQAGALGRAAAAPPSADQQWPDEAEIPFPTHLAKAG